MGSTPENKKSRFSWLFHPASIWGGIILVGPFALPLLWKSKDYKRSTKIFVSVVVITVFFGVLWFSVVETLNQLRALQDLSKMK